MSLQGGPVLAVDRRKIGLSQRFGVAQRSRLLQQQFQVVVQVEDVFASFTGSAMASDALQTVIALYPVRVGPAA